MKFGGNLGDLHFAFAMHRGLGRLAEAGTAHDYLSESNRSIMCFICRSSIFIAVTVPKHPNTPNLP